MRKQWRLRPRRKNGNDRIERSTVTSDAIVPKDFDETTDTDIEDIAVSVGASGARRPPSE